MPRVYDEEEFENSGGSSKGSKSGSKRLKGLKGRAKDHPKKNFVAKFSDDHRLTTGGRKEDSNYFKRKIASKKIAIVHYLVKQIDQLVIVSSFVLPKPKPGLIDRFIILAESACIKPILIFTKRDLVDREQEKELLDVYKNTGYPCYVFSNDEETTKKYSLATSEFLRKKIFAKRKSAVVGHSGVGKTTMLKIVDPSYQARVAPISDFTKKGRHTTTRVRLYDFPFGGTVYDMPGLKVLDYIDLTSNEIKNFYREFERYRKSCEYKNCTHDHEKNCKVKEAVQQGKIHPARYSSYLQIRSTLDD